MAWFRHRQHAAQKGKPIYQACKGGKFHMEHGLPVTFAKTLRWKRFFSIVKTRAYTGTNAISKHDPRKYQLMVNKRPMVLDALLADLPDCREYLDLIAM